MNTLMQHTPPPLQIVLLSPLCLSGLRLYRSLRDIYNPRITQSPMDFLKKLLFNYYLKNIT